jgi:alpha-1,3-mannosyltransferase
MLCFASYTEIDWRAYMQEVSGFLSGELSYTKLKGDTGPLVYPAGFVHVFSALYYITRSGANIALAQLIFGAIYLSLTALVLRIYQLSHVPVAYTAVLVLSRRVHSIFILRLFNDGVAMLLLYFAVFLMCSRRVRLGSLVFSAAVSIKMNVLLFAPGLLVVWTKTLSPLRVVENLVICAMLQIVLAMPFLVYDPVGYFSKAFELDRVFSYRWTVNYKFLPEDLFADRRFGAALLVLTASCWTVAYWRRWRHRDYTRARSVCLTLFESNLIGVILSRTMHYQFYSWFFHQLPYVLFFSCSAAPKSVHFVIIALVDYAFTVYPSSALSGALLMVSLCFTLVAILSSSESTTHR